MASNNFEEERDIGLEEGLGFEGYRSVARFPRLESELLKFVELSRKAKLGVTKKMIVEKLSN